MINCLVRDVRGLPVLGLQINIMNLDRAGQFDRGCGDTCVIVYC